MSRPGRRAVSYHAVCSPQYSDVWMEATSKESDAIVTAGTFAGTNNIPGGSNIVDAKWLYKWESDYHGRVYRRRSVKWLCGIAR